ncbi:MAG TPA: TRAP transporter substrate-binding protein [Usitatibacter sp.]|nr:TRAP transporter substrate-binding protein [Usitatibacter sp.]
MQPLKSFVAVLAAACGTMVSAQTNWDMPTPYADNIFHTQNIRTFVDDVKKATSGQVNITVHSNASLIKHPDILRAVQTGQVPLGEVLISQFGNEDPMFELDSLPFLATGYENAWKLYQASKSTLEKRFASRGIRVLYSVPWPGQAIFSKTPLNTMQDLRGVKFRAYNPATSRIAELAGAVPTTVQAAEVSQAFATNLVSAMLTSSSTGVSSKAWEFSKYYYDTNAWHPRNVVMVNERAFMQLSDAQRNAILNAAAEAEKRGWQMARDNDDTGKRTLATNGLLIVVPGKDLVDGFVKIGHTMQAEWAKRAGPEGEAVLSAYRR